MQVNKKLLQQHLNEKTGKIVTLKDISNIQSRMNSGGDHNDIDCLVTRLRAITSMLDVQLAVALITMTIGDPFVEGFNLIIIIKCNLDYW